MKAVLALSVLMLAVSGVANAEMVSMDSCKVAVTSFRDLKWQPAADADAAYTAEIQKIRAGVASTNAAPVDAEHALFQFSPADVNFTAPTSFSNVFESATNVVRNSSLNAKAKEPVQISWNNHDFSYLRMQIDSTLNPGVPLREILQGKIAPPQKTFVVIGRVIETQNSSTQVIFDTVGLARFVCE